MGAATAVAAGVAIAGIGMSVAQAVKQNKLEKKAKQAAIDAKQRAKGISETNPFEYVQVPTLGNKMAMEEINQSSSNYIQALQDSGAEGVIGGVTGVNQVVNNSLLDVASKQDDAIASRNRDIAIAQSDINRRKADRDYDLEISSFIQAKQDEIDARYNKNQAIQNAFSSAQQGANAFSGSDGGGGSDVGVYNKQKKNKN